MYLGHMITLDYTIILENDYIFENPECVFKALYL